ncbi:MspA family porin [Nocardia sp. 348MFTsu5.1]|uniref:MspA family porin n=1 Tax=Nocardia sp. 348MFTsu5.1 TaxID=1172185 RepID=UPI0003628AFA|nr:MspA family porin [Nocardia sp. 348MFTsu5.1]
MSKFSMRRVVGAGAITAVAAIGLASMGAGNAAAGPLADGSKVTSGVDGKVVKIERTGESAYPVQSVANNGAGRAAEVNGKVKVYSGGTSGTLTTGYIVGCQIDITGLSGTLGGSLNIVNLLAGAPTGGLSGSFTFPLKPGQAVFVSLGSQAFAGNDASIQYQSVGIDVQQCGGYAQARAYSTVTTTGDYVIKSTLYGQPFSLNS